jgi:CheY-like chemotaxis protein
MGQIALVADDDPLMRRLCLVLLEQVGFEAISANNGREAVELARQERPKLIIMDVMMTGMSGLKALGELKQAESTKDIPVIMISGNADRQIQAESRFAGAAAFLRKPFRAAELLEAVRRLVPQPVAKEKPM